MKRDIRPFFPLPGIWSELATAEAVFEFNEKQIYLRQLFDNVVFRTAADTPDITYFLTRKLRVTELRGATQVYEDIADYPEAQLIEELRAGRYGRMINHRSEAIRVASDPFGHIPLFFLPDGSGFYQDEGETIRFDWAKWAIHFYSPAQVWGADAAVLAPLCELLFIHDIWPCMADPYVALADAPEQPFHWAQGSRERLEQITRWIVHTELEPFNGAASNEVIIRYIAETSELQGGVSGFQFSSRLRTLCNLAFDENRFTGGTWQGGWHAYGWRKSEIKRKDTSHIMGIPIAIRVSPPSAHERAEAFAQLAEWLEGKVTEEEQRKYLYGE